MVNNKQLPLAVFSIMYQKLRTFLMFCLLLITVSCNDNVNIEWQPRVVSPLVNGELGVFQQPDIQDISDAFIISASDVFGTRRGTLPALPALGPFNFPLNPTKVSGNDVIDEVGLSNISIRVTLQNNMPVTMASGAIVALTNAGQTDAFVQQTINQSVGPGQSVTLVIKKSTGVLKNTFIASISNVSTLASSSPVTITNNSQISLTVKFDPPTIEYIQFVPGRTSTFETKVDFDTGLRQNTDDVTGDLVINLENKVPLNFSLAVNFLDNADNVIGTVFTPTLNLTVNQNTSERLGSQTIINNLKSASRLQVIAFFNPTTQNRRIDNTAKLLYKFVADLKVKVKVN